MIVAGPKYYAGFFLFCVVKRNVSPPYPHKLWGIYGSVFHLPIHTVAIKCM